MCISAVHPDGQQKQIYVACPGAMIGEEACILSQPHMTMATTIVQSELYAIPSKEVQALFHSEQKTADLMLQYEARKNRMLISQTAMMSFDSAEQRIAKMLLCLCDAYGHRQADGILIALRFTCADPGGHRGHKQSDRQQCAAGFQQRRNPFQTKRPLYDPRLEDTPGNHSAVTIV